MGADNHDSLATMKITDTNDTLDTTNTHTIAELWILHVYYILYKFLFCLY